MENLIEIKTNKNMEVVISGRELHEKLGIETRYNDWIKRMIDYGFTENTDFVAITQKRATAQGNKTTYNDHIIKIDMAKEICLSLIHIWRCRRYAVCRSRWSPYH